MLRHLCYYCQIDSSEIVKRNRTEPQEHFAIYLHDTDKSYVVVVIRNRLHANYIHVHYEDKMVIPSVGRYVCSLYVCILRASMSYNDYRVLFIGVVSING